MKTIQSDGGRAQAGFHTETNDCAVIALSHAAGIGYASAHELISLQGRRPRRGTSTTMIARAFTAGERRGKFTVIIKFTPSPFRETTRRTVWGNRTVYSRTDGMTVAQFISTLPKKGRFFLYSTRHAFAYIDGVIYDNRSKAVARGRVAFCAEITPLVTPEPLPKPVPVAPVKVWRKYPQPQPDVKPELAQSDISEMWERLNKLEDKL